MVGTDIIEVARIEKLIKEKGDKFLNKIYNDIEIKYCESKGPNKYQHYAGFFAAKEACFKAISANSHGKAKVPLVHICIHHHHFGAPKAIILDDWLNENEWPYPSDSLSISISHVKEYAIAVAIYVNDIKLND